MTTVSDHLRRLRKEVDDLPPATSPIVELLCSAQELLIEAERQQLRAPSKWDKDGSFAVAALLHHRQKASQQIKEVLRQLQAIN